MSLLSSRHIIKFFSLTRFRPCLCISFSFLPYTFGVQYQRFRYLRGSSISEIRISQKSADSEVRPYQRFVYHRGPPVSEVRQYQRSVCLRFSSVSEVHVSQSPVCLRDSCRPSQRFVYLSGSQTFWTVEPFSARRTPGNIFHHRIRQLGNNNIRRRGKWHGNVNYAVK